MLSLGSICRMLRLLTIFLSIALLGNAGAAVSGLYTYTVNADNASVTITDYPTNEIGALVIVDTLGGYPVTSIGGNAFFQCGSLTSVTIPDSVTSIGTSAFSNCSSLTSVTIPDSVTSIGSEAFFGCSSLTSVIIPDSVTSIRDFTFFNCTNLTSVIIPDSVTSIGAGAFYACTSLTSVTFPNNIEFTSIRDGAFYGCTGLTSVIIPDSVTSIGAGAFRDCTSLTSIVIPDSVTSIGDSTFSNCSSLTSVTIPDSVTSIGSEAFFGCSSLTSVTLPYNFAYSIPPNAVPIYTFDRIVDALKNDPDFIAAVAQAMLAAENNSGFATKEELPLVEQAGIDQVLADPASYSLYTSATAQEELIDLRTGSTMLNINGSNAVMQLQIQRSDDLSTWTSSAGDIITVELPMQQGKGFYRFAMPQ
jgi:hypothetical protein